MKAILKLLLFVCLPAVALAQTPVIGLPGASAGPYVKAVNYVPETGSASASINTSSTSGGGGSTTVAAGDLVIVACRAGGTVTSDLATDALGNTWNVANFVTISGTVAISLNWSSITIAGSDNFTCTPSASVSAQGMAVADFAGAGSSLISSGTTTQSSSTNNYLNATTVTSSTARSLMVSCAAVNSANPGWLNTTIYGTPAAFGATSNSSPYQGDTACSFVALPQATTHAASFLFQTGASLEWVTVLAAFSY